MSGGWTRHADNAYNAAPRDAAGAWAVFDKNWDQLPKGSGNKKLIGEHLVARAAQDAPMFVAIQRKISAYLGDIGEGGEGGGAQAELVQIDELTEVNTTKGASTFERVKNFIEACEEKERDSKLAIEAAREEAKQAGERAQAAGAAAAVAAAAAGQARTIIEESSNSQDSEAERQQKELAAEKAAEAEAEAERAAREAALAKQRADESSEKSGLASDTLTGGVVDSFSAEARTTLIADWVTVTEPLYPEDGSFVAGDFEEGKLFDDELGFTRTPVVLAKPAGRDWVKSVHDAIVDRTRAYAKLTNKSVDILEASKKSAKAFKTVYAVLNGSMAKDFKDAKGKFHKLLSHDIMAAEYRIHFAIVNAQSDAKLDDKMTDALDWTTTAGFGDKLAATGRAVTAYKKNWDAAI